jgi:succinate-semialdehyde dehydrogenase / glutarate-semialdehyde dehydrogenase
MNLIQGRYLTDGWHDTAATFVTEPASGDVLGRAADCDAEAEARPRSTSPGARSSRGARRRPFERSPTLRRWHGLIVAHQDELAA